MFVFKIGDSKIRLFADGPNQKAAPEPLDPGAISVLIQLNGSYGAFGHLFDSGLTTAIDMDYALRQAGYDVQILEGNLQVYDPEIPEGAQT